MAEIAEAGLQVQAGAPLTGELMPNPSSGESRWPIPSVISDLEWSTARMTPPCVVENYIWADVRLLVAPGGVGKTTVVLTESIHIVLARPLYGLEIKESGVVVIVTAEDGREMMIARLRSIAKSMNLTEDETRLVRERVIILDVVGLGLRLTAVTNNVVVTDNTVDQMIENLRHLAPSMVIIDPAVSFGVGESRVNDAEQGLIEAARHIHRVLGCNVTYIHHTGQSVAREKIRDQYAGRGGSAFADGSRMVNVLMPLAAAEWLKETGQPLPEDSTGMVLARAKQTYTPPQPDIYLLRTGFLYTAVEPVEPRATANVDADAAKILVIIEEDTSQTLTTNKLELMSKDIGIGQKRIRDLLKVLIEDGRVIKVGKSGVKQGAHHYLITAKQHAENPPQEVEQ
ncbi:MAG: AAA family ATPase [Pseudomonadales bacterium]